MICKIELLLRLAILDNLMARFFSLCLKEKINIMLGARKVSRKAEFIVFALVFFSWGQSTVLGAEFDVYGKSERFTWSEYDSSGIILKESGPLFTVGLVSTTPNADHSFTRTDIAYFGGTVNYDGSTWSGTPVVSDTIYSGYKLEYTFYHPISAATNRYSFLGLGYKQWNRDLISTQSSQGYLENWRSLYAKIGYRQEAANSRFEFGLKYPLKTVNSVDIFGSKAHPGRHASVFGEVSWTIAKDADIRLNYDSMKFTASKPTYAPRLGQYVYQPKSKSSSWGLQLAVKL
jgi:hypothetical protein